MSDTIQAPHRRPHPGDVPQELLIIAGFVLLLTILAAAFGHANKHAAPPTASEMAARSLLFDDMPDGSVKVSDAASHAQIAILPPGSNGFIRATMRGLAHAGSHEVQAAAQHAVLLTAWSDGRLTLDDPVSGRRIDLEAFGQTNSGAYAQLLTGEGLTGGAPK